MPPKKKAGRPKGSKNKPKPDTAGVDRPQEAPLATHYTTPIPTGRADKGVKRGPHKPKEPPIPVNPLPPLTSQTTSATRERTQTQAGAIRARGHTLEGAFAPKAPVGGWSGVNPDDISSMSGYTGKTKSSEIRDELSQMEANKKIKITKLDHPDVNPADWTQGKIDGLIIDRELAKRESDTFGEEEAQRWWLNKREQEKAVIRKQERKHHELLHGKSKEEVIGDIDKISQKMQELEEELAREEGRAYEGGGRVDPEKQAELKIRRQMSLNEKLKQIDLKTNEGKSQAWYLLTTDKISDLPQEGPIESGGETTRTSRTPVARGTPLEGQTLKPQSGLTATERLFGTYAYGASAGLGPAGIALGAVAPSLIKSVGEGLVSGYKNVKEKEREKARRIPSEQSHKLVDEIMGRDKERRKAEIKETQRLGRERIKTQLVKEREKRDEKRAHEKRVKDVDTFVSDLIGDVGLTLSEQGLTFPAEAKKEEKQVESGRLNRRRKGKEIFTPHISLGETPVEEKVRKQREEERMKLATEKVKAIRQKAKDQYLKDASKSIHERLREEERKSAHHRITEPRAKPPSIVDDIMGGATEKTISFVPSRRTPLPEPEPEPSAWKDFPSYAGKKKPQPEPEPEDDSTDYDTAEELTEEETDPEDWESESAMSEPDILRLHRRPGVGLFAGEQQIKPVLKLKQPHAFQGKVITEKPVLRLKGRKALKLTPKTEEEFVKAQGPTPQPKPPLAEHPEDIKEQMKLLQQEKIQEEKDKAEFLAGIIEPQTTARYARGTTEQYLGERAEEYKRDKDRLAQLKGYLHNNGIRASLVDSRSKKDRSAKDRIIDAKLSEMRGSGEYERIKQSIADAIQLSKKIGRRQQQAQQAKKKKK